MTFQVARRHAFPRARLENVLFTSVAIVMAPELLVSRRTSGDVAVGIPHSLSLL